MKRDGYRSITYSTRRLHHPNHALRFIKRKAQVLQ